jgi:hypothetical protein
VRRTLALPSLLFAVLGPAAAMAPAHSQESEKGCNIRLGDASTASATKVSVASTDYK